MFGPEQMCVYANLLGGCWLVVCIYVWLSVLVYFMRVLTISACPLLSPFVSGTCAVVPACTCVCVLVCRVVCWRARVCCVQASFHGRPPPPGRKGGGGVSPPQPLYAHQVRVYSSCHAQAGGIPRQPAGPAPPTGFLGDRFFSPGRVVIRLVGLFWYIIQKRARIYVHPARARFVREVEKNK